MEVNYRKIESLPKLSWLAEVNKTDNGVTVYCGPKVECRPDFFVAGIWDGEFEKGRFDISESFYGTGCIIKSDELVFCTPSHALQRLVLTESDESVMVSNSLSFLLAKANLKLDRTIDQYESLFCSILDGPEKMVHLIPLDGGEHLRQVIVGLIKIKSNCSVTIENRQKQRPFKDFNDYESRICEMLRKVRENSISSDRVNTHFGIVSTISSGYDSPCCSALAKDIGCDTVLSLSGGQYENDDGTGIAVILKYNNIIRRNMLEYRNKKGCIDAEFFADGELASSMQFCVFEDLFEDNIVVEGLRGSYWDREATMKENFEMQGYFNNESDTSITEHSLIHGYIILPLPAFGASVCNSIFAISNSDEMKSYSIGGKYDKPIPRRILESRGVRRESFGQVKYGGGFSFSRDNRLRLKHRMSEEGYRNFIEFVNNGNGCQKNIGRFLHLLKYVSLNLPSYCNFAFSKLHINLRFKQKPSRYANPGIVADLLFWGTDVMARRYKAALEGKMANL